jgi:prophage antirepressor-like protein
MSNLALVKSASFGNIQCDIFMDSKTKNFYMTRNQIGEALEYANPTDAIRKIHHAHKDRLDQLSRAFRSDTPSGKQTTVLYSAKGIYEICRWSQQPKANEFYDFVYERLEELRTGQMVMTPANARTVKSAEQIQLELDTRARNSRVREGNLYLKIANQFKTNLSNESIQSLVGLAAATVHGNNVLPLPKIETTYSAEDIGKEVGVSSNMVGRTANKAGLKIDKYGMTVLDKSPYSSKQIPAFRYNELGRARLMELLRAEGE